MAADSESRACNCGFPELWARDPGVPVRFKSELNEYVLITHGGRFEHNMHYCFWCGGRLPESRRGELFAEMSQGELDDVRTLLSNITTLDGAVSALGAPDAELTADDYKSDEGAEPLGAISPRRSLVFSSRWKTLDVTVNEMEDGSLSYTCSPKYLGSSGN